MTKPPADKPVQPPVLPHGLGKVLSPTVLVAVGGVVWSLLLFFAVQQGTAAIIEMDAIKTVLAQHPAIARHVDLAIALPYIELAVGLLLTLVLGMYVRVADARGQETSDLALSLRKTNDDLHRQIAERHETEFKLLRAKEQADFANRSKSEFLANMSHELRTPLNAIIGFAEIIKEQMFGPVGAPQYVEYAGDIYDSGQLLLSLINDILDMSKIEAGKRALVETTLDIELITKSVIRLVASRAKLGKLHLNARVPKDLPNLRGEEKALKQVLTNLLTNAIKFTPEGGEVTLEARCDESNRLQIIVTDTGIGIAPDDISVALTPFGQIESALSRKQQGTGLGLPLTKALIELHGGTLTLESTLGKGTTVTVSFPAERVAKKSH